MHERDSRRSRWRPGRLLAAVLLPSLAPAGAEAAAAPAIPEPMIFDMVRPMGAKRGELETNALFTRTLADGEKVEWAPEVEYAFADGLAVEFEFPFENQRPVALKLGLQATFGTFDGGRSIHGVQYIGIYDRHDRRYASAAVYMLGHRFGARVSSMTMVGVGGVGARRSAGRNALIVNQSVFHDLGGGDDALGVEINYLGGRRGGVLVVPQVHHRLSPSIGVQAGLGIDRRRGERARPTAGLRLIKEL